MASWELPWSNLGEWAPLQVTGSLVQYAGLTHLIVGRSGGELSVVQEPGIQGLEAINKRGIAMHRMRILHAYSYAGTLYHQNIAVILPHNQEHLPAIWCFCSSHEYNEAVPDRSESKGD